MGLAVHVESRAEEPAAGGEEVRRTDDAPGDAFRVIGEDRAGVGQVHGHAVLGGESLEHVRVGDVEPLLEQEVAEGQADPLARGGSRS